MSAQDAARLRSALTADAPDLLAYFERRVPAREDAADLLGEVMLQAWRRHVDTPMEPQRARMWLFGIARNVLANHHRSVRRRGALTAKLRSLLRECPADEPEGQAVRDAVERLRPEYRDLVTLIHWDGFSVSEAAEILGLNPSTGRSRYSAARSQLAEALGLSVGH